MSGDWVGTVGFFECLDLLRGLFEAECGDRVFKMPRLGSAYDRGGDAGFVEQPGQGRKVSGQAGESLAPSKGLNPGLRWLQSPPDTGHQRKP